MRTHISESTEVSHGTKIEIMPSFVAWKIQTSMQQNSDLKKNGIPVNDCKSDAEALT